MKKHEIDPLARLMFEAIQQLGRDADPLSLSDRIKRLELGIPAEDEFAFILSWLGKCILIHKLDQNQYPPESVGKLQVPDLFACFVKDDVSVPVLIEVKVSNKTKLSSDHSPLLFRTLFDDPDRTLALVCIDHQSTVQGHSYPTTIPYSGLASFHANRNKSRKKHHPNRNTVLPQNPLIFLCGVLN